MVRTTIHSLWYTTVTLMDAMLLFFWWHINTYFVFADETSWLGLGGDMTGFSLCFLRLVFSTHETDMKLCHQFFTPDFCQVDWNNRISLDFRPQCVPESWMIETVIFFWHTCYWSSDWLIYSQTDFNTTFWTFSSENFSYVANGKLCKV